MKPFAAAGKDLAALSEGNRQGSAAAIFRAGLAAARTSRPRSPAIAKTVKNVLGSLAGSDPVLKDQWIVVGRAITIIWVLAIANSLGAFPYWASASWRRRQCVRHSGCHRTPRVWLRATKPQWKRSVLFMAFAGEEIGLLGLVLFR